MSAPVEAAGLRIAVAIATAGRPAVLADTLDHLRHQERAPDEIAICPAAPEDVDRDRLAGTGLDVRIVAGTRGLPAQRNALMDACRADVIVFIDDDYLLAPDFLGEAERLFATRPGVVVATGAVLADGILTPGLDFAEGVAVLDRAGPNRGGAPVPAYNAYGCNMLVRLGAARERGIRFDETLPLYAWQEDVDFSRQLAPFGEIVRSSRLRGVHLGTKRSGRSPGRRLGYSQIANPIYLARKGTMHWRRSLKQIARNVAANAARSLSAEPWVDRRGRLAGNLRGLLDLALGRLTPARALEM